MGFTHGDTAVDIYSRAVSDVYQDLFGSGIYVGKGAYDVEAFRRSLEGRVPENALASHDLFEGIHGRAALATDIVLYECEQAAAALRVSLVEIAARAERLALTMDFGLLYDKDLRLFHIGYNVAADRLDPHHYDLLASAARLASLFAIARGDAPVEHWFHLGRATTVIARHCWRMARYVRLSVNSSRSTSASCDCLRLHSRRRVGPPGTSRRIRLASGRMAGSIHTQRCGSGGPLPTWATVNARLACSICSTRLVMLQIVPRFSAIAWSRTSWLLMWEACRRTWGAGDGRGRPARRPGCGVWGSSEFWDLDDHPVVRAGQAVGQRGIGEQRRVVAAPAGRVQDGQPRDV